MSLQLEGETNLQGIILVTACNSLIVEKLYHHQAVGIMISRYYININQMHYIEAWA